MSMNYFKKLGESAPNDLARYIENDILRRRGSEKVTKHNQYSHARIISAEEAKNSSSSQILYTVDMGGDFCDIWGIAPTLMCNDFLVRDDKGDRPHHSELLANFMLENLKGEDKANYVNDYQKFWQKRIESQYTNTKSNLQKTVDKLNTLVDENAPLI